MANKGLEHFGGLLIQFVARRSLVPKWEGEPHFCQDKLKKNEQENLLCFDSIKHASVDVIGIDKQGLDIILSKGM